MWLSGGATQQEVTAHLAGYASRNITVGAVDIDSSWSTGYNNFVVGPLLRVGTRPLHNDAMRLPHSEMTTRPPRADKNQWPDLPGFTATLHAAGQRVILWCV